MRPGLPRSTAPRRAAEDGAPGPWRETAGHGSLASRTRGARALGYRLPPGVTGSQATLTALHAAPTALYSALVVPYSAPAALSVAVRAFA